MLKGVLTGVALFVAFTIAMNALSYYAESSAVGIRRREQIRGMIDWYPLTVYGRPM